MSELPVVWARKSHHELQDGILVDVRFPIPHGFFLFALVKSQVLERQEVNQQSWRSNTAKSWRTVATPILLAACSRSLPSTPVVLSPFRTRLFYQGRAFWSDTRIWKHTHFISDMSLGEKYCRCRAPLSTGRCGDWNYNLMQHWRTINLFQSHSRE